MSTKIQPQHLDRPAVVYLRQSTLRQVHDHRESTARQYGLKERAISLGWPAHRVEVIDEDLGQSGTRVEGRSGFQRLAESVARGRIGAIFALEVSRLSRRSADWHRLLDLCGVADVIIVDEQAIYAPEDYNDRLLLGLKGQMSEAEQYWMRLRLQGGALAKARRGELRMCPPVGFQWDDRKASFRLDGDEQVQRVVRLVFDRFRVDSSAHAVTRYLQSHDIQLPSRKGTEIEMRWRPAKYRTVLRMLRHPIYAGAYTYGRREHRRTLVDGEVRLRRGAVLPAESWKVLLPDRHPGYITWEEYMAIQQKLDTNRSDHRTPDHRGAPREGRALLQGLVLCGRCGHRMRVAYIGKEARPYYECRSPAGERAGRSICCVVAADPVDEWVARQFLELANPPEVDLGLAVTREAERQAEDLGRQWELRIERARYEARLAERRYKAVDPDNRIVARSLEREWEERLREVEEAEEGYLEARRRRHVDLSDEDHARVLSLARNLRKVWDAPTTGHADRKNLLRMVVREVAVEPIDVPQPQVRVRVLWETGSTTEVHLPRRTRATACATSSTAVARIHELWNQGEGDDAIATLLNQEGFRTGTGRAWSAQRVQGIRSRHDLEGRSRRAPEVRGDGLYSVMGLARRLGVSESIVRGWAVRGVIHAAAGGGQGRPRWFAVDDAAIAELAARREATPDTGRGTRNSKNP